MGCNRPKKGHVLKTTSGPLHFLDLLVLIKKLKKFWKSVKNWLIVGRFKFRSYETVEKGWNWTWNSVLAIFTNLQVECFNQTYRTDVSWIDKINYAYIFAIKFKVQGYWGQYKVQWGKMGEIRSFGTFDQFDGKVFQRNLLYWCILDRKGDLHTYICHNIQMSRIIGVNIRSNGAISVKFNILLFWSPCRWNISTKLAGLTCP